MTPAKKPVIVIKYDGEWPNLCSGRLTAIIDGVEYLFPRGCLRSGGRVWFSDDYATSHVEEGPWEIREWPDGFPGVYKQAVLDKVNEDIPHGCCGGCI